MSTLFRVRMTSRPFVVSQQKLAEKLTILKDRGMGMLTRIYNIKKGGPRTGQSNMICLFI